MDVGAWVYLPDNEGKEQNESGVKHPPEEHKNGRVRSLKSPLDANPDRTYYNSASHQQRISHKPSWQFIGPRRLQNSLDQARHKLWCIRANLAHPWHHYVAEEVESILEHMSAGPFDRSSRLSFEVEKVAEFHLMNMIEELVEKLHGYASYEDSGVDDSEFCTFCTGIMERKHDRRMRKLGESEDPHSLNLEYEQDQSCRSWKQCSDSSNPQICLHAENGDAEVVWCANKASHARQHREVPRESDERPIQHICQAPSNVCYQQIALVPLAAGHYGNTEDKNRHPQLTTQDTMRRGSVEPAGLYEADRKQSERLDDGRPSKYFTHPDAPGKDSHPTYKHGLHGINQVCEERTDSRYIQLHDETAHSCQCSAQQHQGAQQRQECAPLWQRSMQKKNCKMELGTHSQSTLTHRIHADMKIHRDESPPLPPRQGTPVRLENCCREEQQAQLERHALSLEKDIGLSIGYVDMIIEETRHVTRTTTFDNPKHRRDLRDTERKLLAWLIRLAKREITESYQPCSSECRWIGIVARFYNAYVEYLQSYFSKTSPEQTGKYAVFISHTGTEKQSYARPLHAFLEKHSVSAFIDADIPMGDDSHKTLLQALVTCRYSWCVVSKSFVQEEWPMRELMISYVRFVREKGNDFCLIMDCFEDGNSRRPVGYWMEFVRHAKALRPHDMHGSPQEFPGKMQRARDYEGYHERIARIAGEKLANGQVIVPLFVSNEKDGRDLVECDRFPMDSLCGKIRNAKTIRILTTWISNLPHIEEALVDALIEGASFHVLLLSPDSIQANARNQALEDLRVPAKYLQNGVAWNMDQMKSLCKKAGIVPGTVSASRVQVRFYDSAPSMSVYQTDEHAYVGFFCRGQLAGSGPHIGATSDSSFGRRAITEIDNQWNGAKHVCF